MVPQSELPALLETHRTWLLRLVEANLPGDVRRSVGASDIVQETLAEAAALGRLATASARALLKTIAENNLRDAIRRARRDCRDTGRTVALAGLHPEDEDGSAAARAVALEQVAIVNGAIERLPAEVAALLRQRFGEGLPLAEIGRREGLSPSSIAKRLGAALEALRLELAKDGVRGV